MFFSQIVLNSSVRLEEMINHAAIWGGLSKIQQAWSRMQVLVICHASFSLILQSILVLHKICGVRKYANNKHQKYNFFPKLHFAYYNIIILIFCGYTLNLSNTLVEQIPDLLFAQLLYIVIHCFFICRSHILAFWSVEESTGTQWKIFSLILKKRYSTEHGNILG